MTPRPHWLRTPAALPRHVHERRAILGRIVDTLSIIAVVAAALAIGKGYIEWAAADLARDQGYAQHHAAEQCPMPTEDERTVITITHRDGKLEARCLLVGSRQAYHRTPDGMPGARP